MSITAKFFARLREEVGMAEKELQFTGSMTVADVWQQSCGDKKMPANTLCAVNMEYVMADHPVSDGDEVAFFPPVTGG